MTRQKRREIITGLLFVSPWIAGFGVFLLIPALMSLYYSLCDYSVLSPPVYIGFGNYIDLATDRIFLKSVWNTIVFAFMVLPLSTVLSILLAVLISSARIGRPLFRTLFFLPALVPLVAMGILWSWIFNSDYGILNYVLEILFEMFGLGEYGITSAPDWLGDPSAAKFALVITVIWSIGQSMVIYFAGLRDIPRSYYEVALVDGANWWHQLVHITLPALSPIIYFNLIMGCISVLQVFAVPYVMMGAQGDPLRSTLFYLMYMFDQAFRKLNMGYACAMAWALFVVIAALTYTAHKLMIRHVHYDGA